MSNKRAFLRVQIIRHITYSLVGTQTVPSPGSGGYTAGVSELSLNPDPGPTSRIRGSEAWGRRPEYAGVPILEEACGTGP